MAQAAPIWHFHLYGPLCLDFANTVSWRGSARETEHMGSYADLLSFAQQAGVLSSDEATRLALRAARHPVDAERVAERARELRDALYQAFREIVDRGMPPQADLATINRALSDAMAHVRLEGTSLPYKLAWGDPDTLDRMLGPVLNNAVELLASPNLASLRCCANPKCGWLFVDTSRNRLRRWCDMRVCGNRGKAARFHERHRAP